MHRMRSGPAAVHETATRPVEKPSRTAKSHQTTSNSTPTHDPRNNAARGFCFALIFEALAVAVIVGACFLVDLLLAHPDYCWLVIAGGVLAIMATVDRWMA